MWLSEMGWFADIGRYGSVVVAYAFLPSHWTCIIISRKVGFFYISAEI